MWGAERALRGRRIKVSVGCMAVAIVLGVTFILIQLKEYHDKTYGITTNLYGSLYFTITGFHLCHVAVGSHHPVPADAMDVARLFRRQSATRP